MSAMLKEEERTRTTIYSRVMGYHSPTHLWNTGKKGEWDDRRTAYFKEPKEESNGTSILVKQ